MDVTRSQRLRNRRATALLLAAACSVCALACGSAAADSASPWYGSAEALWLQLDHGSNSNTPVVLDSTTGATLLGANDLTYSMEAGPRLTLGRRLDRDTAIEMVYFGLNDWDASRAVSGDNDLRIPGDLGLTTLDFFNADQLNVSQNATINNVEANFWSFAGDSGPSLAAGFRYLNFDERFRISGQDTDTGASRYSVNTRNNLFGAQLGARYRGVAGAKGRLGIETYAKAGIFGNGVGMNQRVTDFDNTFVARNTDVSAGRIAFVGDIGATGIVRLTDSVNLRLGYTLIWVDGVARAANQLDFSDSQASGTSLAYGQGAFLQGVTAGFEWGW